MNLYGPWENFSVIVEDWHRGACHAAMCADEWRCTVANAARRQLLAVGYADAQTWVIVLVDDSDNITGYRLTAKVYEAGAWRLFYWTLGLKTSYIAAQTDKQGSIPPWEVTETLLVATTPRLSEIRGKKSPQQAEERRAGIETARAKRKAMISVGKILAETEVRLARGGRGGCLVTGNPALVGQPVPAAFWPAWKAAQTLGVSPAACVESYKKSIAPPLPKRGFGARRRLNPETAGQVYTGDAV